MRTVIAIICAALIVVCLGAAGYASDATALSSAKDKPMSTVSPPPFDQSVVKQGGDDVSTATVIPSIPYTNSGTTAGYTDDYDEICPYDEPGSPDVVYAYTAPTDDYIQIELCQSLYDTKVYIYENAVTAGAPYACNDDACGDDGYKSGLYGIPIFSGNTYYIVIDGYGGDAGTYDLSIFHSGPPPVCPAQSVFAQETATPSDAWSAGISDVRNGADELRRFEYFSGVTTPVKQVVFWALRGFNDGTGWSECSEEPIDVLVEFFQDNAGLPGTSVANFTVSASGLPTVYPFSDFQLYEFTVNLPSAVALTDGWISIEGVTDPSCWLLWMNSFSGLDNSHVLLDGATGGMSVEEDDLAFCLVGSDCSWTVGDEYKMHYPQMPWVDGWAVNASSPTFIGDDWMCTETGWVKDLHFWGAWHDNVEGVMTVLWVEIWSDVPDPDGDGPEYSHPGDQLMVIPVEPGQMDIVPMPAMVQDWYDPSTGVVVEDDHSAWYQYNICLDEQNWFWQDEGTVYWLVIHADVPQGQWGWKASLDHWNDDAVHTVDPPLWNELFEPANADTVVNGFTVVMNEFGEVIAGGGDDAYGDGWYFYPEDDWWNIWFYDHPFDEERYKTIYIEFDAFPMGPEAYIELAVNWSTDLWFYDFPAIARPPLPGEPEVPYIGRQTLFAAEQFEGHYVVEYVIPDYNPEWVSIDIRGFNFEIPMGFIQHACTADRGPSMDMSFVITGEPPMGACCDSLGNCTMLTAADCAAANGIYSGDGTDCASVVCGQTGACCGTNCSQVTQVWCQSTGRQYVGDGVPCDPDPCGCCIGTVGNVQIEPDCDPTDQTVDISDLTNLIDYLFISFRPICCVDEADISPLFSGGVPDGIVDIGDLTDMIDHLFIGFGPMPACP